MFYPVKVLDDEGKVKKIVTSRELSRRYWESFHKEMEGERSFKMGKNKGRRKKGKKLDIANFPVSSN
ncbi:MAG: hypothetical protein ACE5G9_11470 [Nitrospinales bacterium]